MKNEVFIYLAGKIQKAHEDPNETYWTEEDQQQVRQTLAPCTVHFLNPAIRTDDLSDQKSVFGRDMTQVFSSDIVFVDVRERRGLGVGAEMMWAKMNGRAVIALAPQDSHYNKKNTSLLGVEVYSWVHPFVENLSDAIVDTPAAGGVWIRRILSGEHTIKGPESIHEAMRYYLDHQYSTDEPMQQISRSSCCLQERIHSISSSEALNGCEPLKR